MCRSAPRGADGNIPPAHTSHHPRGPQHLELLYRRADSRKTQALAKIYLGHVSAEPQSRGRLRWHRTLAPSLHAVPTPCTRLLLPTSPFPLCCSVGLLGVLSQCQASPLVVSATKPWALCAGRAVCIHLGRLGAPPWQGLGAVWTSTTATRLWPPQHPSFILFSPPEHLLPLYALVPALCRGSGCSKPQGGCHAGRGAGTGVEAAPPARMTCVLVPCDHSATPWEP